MRLAYCDCFSGISGDMFLGALIDAGLPLNYLREKIRLLDLTDDYELLAEETHKVSLRAIKFQVSENHHNHEHDHHEGEDHHHQHRHYDDIVALIEASSLSDRVKTTALSIFQKVAEAEASVHGTPVKEVHFHEVGALDSIVDIVGAAIGLEYLNIERLYASALPWSTGQVNTQHGILPIPAPATLEILKMAHAPLVPSEAQVELVTPTGAAIVAALATFDRPSLSLTAVGVGAGGRDLPWANIMRLIIGESGGKQESQPLVLMETNIDDMNPQIFGHVMDRLFKSGALDVFMTPIYMKKNRPATMLGVIARQADEAVLARIILEETSTFGLRVQPIYRYEAQRKMELVDTEYGSIPVKIKLLEGNQIQAVPEYDECARIAAEKGLPLVTIYSAAFIAGKSLLKPPA